VAETRDVEREHVLARVGGADAGTIDVASILGGQLD
jgi:hypothetical protein